MDEIKHWWNLTKSLTKLDGEGINNCQMYYIQCCKQLSKQIELPKQNFGPGSMCSYCGSLWSKNEPQTRIVSGRNMSKSVKQIVKCSENNQLSRFHSTLMKKSLKNQMNKIVIKCSVCLRSTKIDCTKPKRRKLLKTEIETSTINTSQRKKKKRFKDKTAGLNLSNIESPNMNKQKNVIPTNLNFTNISIKKPKCSDLTPVRKVKNINLKKLNDILKASQSEKSKNSLSSFLKELY